MGTSFDSFWTEMLSGSNMYLKPIGPDFILDTYVAYLDFINLNAALRSC